MKKVEFKRLYIIQFLATWTANNYADACARSEHKRLENPPVEDAEHLAEAAWKACEKQNLMDNWGGFLASTVSGDM